MEKKRGTGSYQWARRSGPSRSWRSRQTDHRPSMSSKSEEESSDRISPSRAHGHANIDGQRGLDPPVLVGTCPDMCPVKERVERERLRDLCVLERVNGDPGKTSSNLAVKKFCRTINTVHVQPSDIRPPLVLEKTLNYLLGLMESSEHPFEVVHDFVFDRTRSIRQDLNMQNITNGQSIYLYEEMVKFHVTSHQKLAIFCDNSDISSLRYLNMEQLKKCLLSLFVMYEMNRRSNSVSKNEAEYYSLYVLLHLGQKAPATGDSLSSWFCRLPLPILRAKEMQRARCILRHFRMGNYKRFFSTIAADASHLQLCLIEPFVDEVRAQAISYINYSGYKLHPYPLGHLSRLLMIKEQELEALCSECGLETSVDESGRKNLPVKQTSFCQPKERMRSYRLLISEGI